MQVSEIVQLVPRLPPALCGVGDYAFLLAEELDRSHGIKTTFIVADPWWSDGAGSRRFPILQLTQRGPIGLAETLSQHAAGRSVLLHYSSYGYAPRGTPLYLWWGLQRWLSSAHGGLLAVFFHELYATGAVWTSAFWLSRLQRRICYRLACLARVCFANRVAAAAELSRVSGHAPGSIPVLPVFSNLGEPKAVLPLASREPQLALYGGPCRVKSNERRAYEAIRASCERLRITKVVTFGPETVAPVRLGVRVQSAGILPASEVSSLLSASRAGYIDYYSGLLGRSGVFAAFCAHGLLPILLDDNQSEADGLVLGREYLSASDSSVAPGPAEQQRIADSARNWYAAHSRCRTTEIIATSLRRMAR
jgi:hypothetical protein